VLHAIVSHVAQGVDERSPPAQEAQADGGECQGLLQGKNNTGKDGGEC
jgi:hypothetical protein